LKISNFQSWGTDIGEGYCFTGDTVTHGWTPAFSINQQYKFLQGYYKFDQQGNDTAEVAFNVFLLGNALGEGSIKFGDTKDEWTFFSIPVTYYLPLTPDAATLRLVSANNNQTSNLGTTLYLDELEFTNELRNTVSTNDGSFENITVYPIPFENHINFNCEGGQYKISNMNGQIVANGHATNGKNKIALNHLPRGVYILTIEDNNKKWQQKIIK
ncbi:MAG: T9SS type A sorting domain-containing protein, partial [Bacteroidia bacterium]